MTKNIIVDREAPILRELAKEVPREAIGSKKLTDTIAKMQKALHAEEDGVAIAAPQIGVSLQLFVVSGETLSYIKKKKNKGPADEKEVKVKSGPDEVYINPEIIKFSKKKSFVEEGCLSVRWYYGQVLRSEKVTLRALDAKGHKIEKGASGLLAQIFQHEVDHLNGILFTDKATNLENLPPENHD